MSVNNLETGTLNHSIIIIIIFTAILFLQDIQHLLIEFIRQDILLFIIGLLRQYFQTQFRIQSYLCKCYPN